MRILHVPYSTPYVKKLRNSQLFIVNSGDVEAGAGIGLPQLIDFRYLAEMHSFDFVDVIHIHFFELDDFTCMQSVLHRCLAQNVRVVVTIHDPSPIFCSPLARYRRKLELLCECSSSIITLTRGAAEEINRQVRGAADKMRIIPHGFSAEPGRVARGRTRQDSDPVVFSLFGSTRENRDVYAIAKEWVTISSELPPSRLKMYLRCTADDCAIVERLETLERRREVGLEICTGPYLPDEGVIMFLQGCSVLIMPYRWGSHSGQLELAFDLDLIPVIPDIGYYREQWLLHRDFVEEPVWFDWNSVYSDSSAALPAVNALEKALQQAMTKRFDADARSAFERHRMLEHSSIIKAHLDVYGFKD